MVGPDIRPYLAALDLPTRPDQDVIDAHTVPRSEPGVPEPPSGNEECVGIPRPVKSINGALDGKIEVASEQLWPGESLRPATREFGLKATYVYVFLEINTYPLRMLPDGTQAVAG